MNNYKLVQEAMNFVFEQELGKALDSIVKYLEGRSTYFGNDLLTLYSLNSELENASKQQILYKDEEDDIKFWIKRSLSQLILNIKDEQEQLSRTKKDEIVLHLKEIEKSLNYNNSFEDDNYNYLLIPIKKFENFIHKYHTYFYEEFYELSYQAINEAPSFKKFNQFDNNSQKKKESKISSKFFLLLEKLKKENDDLYSDKVFSLEKIPQLVKHTYEEIMISKQTDSLKKLKELFLNINEEFFYSKAISLEMKYRDNLNNFHSANIEYGEYFQKLQLITKEHLSFVDEVNLNYKYLEEKISNSKEKEKHDEIKKQVFATIGEIKKLLSKAEVDKALDTLYNLTDSLSQEISNQVLVVKANYSDFKKKQRLGIENDNTRFNQINFAITELTNETIKIFEGSSEQSIPVKLP